MAKTDKTISGKSRHAQIDVGAGRGATAPFAEAGEGVAGSFTVETITPAMVPRRPRKRNSQCRALPGRTARARRPAAKPSAGDACVHRLGPISIQAGDGDNGISTFSVPCRPDRRLPDGRPDAPRGGRNVERFCPCILPPPPV